MKHMKIGDIFTSEMKTLVNPVNCVGVMGGGLALQFKKRFPDMFILYRQDCGKHLYKPGNCILYRINDMLYDSIINISTKDHYKDPSQYEYIEKGLDDFLSKYKSWKLQSIAFPLLGAGLGGLDEKKVEKIMKEKLKDVDIDIEIWRLP